MEDIIDFFGAGLLTAVAAIGLVKVYMTFIAPGGILYFAVSSFMHGICG